jgi:hypothetical protein
MTDKTKSALREEVREHYAQAAQVVLDQAGRTSGGCCGSPAEVSCCDTGSAALDSADWAGAALYGEGGTEGPARPTWSSARARSKRFPCWTRQLTW